MAHSESTVSDARDFVDTGGRLDRDLYRAQATSDGFLLSRDATFPFRRAVAVAEARGRILRVGPWVAANVLADSLRSDGTPEQRMSVLEPLESGALIAALVLPFQASPGRPPRVSGAGDGVVLDGAAALVQHALDADVLLVAAEADDGWALFIVPTAREGVSVIASDALDGTRALGTVTFSGVRLGASDRLGFATDIERQLQLALLLSLAETIGAMEQVFTSALAYSKERFAFGRPIGSFQVIKHSLVDASLALESSKALADALLESLLEGREDAAELASIAKSFVARAGIDLAHIAWQTYGGIAYTWANDFHLYLRRITSDAVLTGDSTWHDRRIDSLHEMRTA